MHKISEDTETFLHFGGGAYNAFSTIVSGSKSSIKKLDIGYLLNAIVTEVSWIRTLGDDPRDYEAIELGFKYYDKI